jgi:hypothetical protein
MAQFLADAELALAVAAIVAGGGATPGHYLILDFPRSSLGARHSGGAVFHCDADKDARRESRAPA